MSVSGLILRLFGWGVKCSVPDYPKSIICVAPHTSNWDFPLGKLAYWSVGRRAGFLIKASWFFFPMNLIFKAMGGIAVSHKKGHSLTDLLTAKFKACDSLNIAITPEGTRAKVSEWHTGFLRIAYEADIPIILAAINAPTKTVIIENVFFPTGDIDADMAAIKAYYKDFVGIKAENFTV